MENLNAEQIIKALECCAYGLCRDCALYSDDGCGDKVIIGAIELINSQEQKIFELENRLKECENGYEGTLHLESCKLHDAEEKVKGLTQAHEMLSESYDHLEKTKDELLSERSRLTEENESLTATIKVRGETIEKLQFFVSDISEDNRKFAEENERLSQSLANSKSILANSKADTVEDIKLRFAMRFGTYTDKDMTPITEVFRLLDQIAKEMLEGEK